MPASGGLIGQGSPESRQHGGKSPAVLALHGYGGTPVEVDLVVKAAQSLGLAAHSPLLRGHGWTAADLATTRFDDWLGSARDAFQELSAEYGKVVVVGLSMGSLLAAELCLQQPSRVVGLGLLANAFWLRGPFPAWPLAAYHRFALPDVHLPKHSADIQEPEARQNHLTLSAQPARSASEVWAHGRRLRDRLGAIVCPAYLAHGQKDRVCPVRNLRRVAARLGSTRVRTRCCQRSGHIVTRDYDARLVFDDLVAFLGDLSQPS